MEEEAELQTNTSYALKKKYAKRLLTLTKSRGVSHLRIDDIIKYMDISKATFYKYFASKEDALEQFIGMLASNMLEVATQVQDSSSSYVQRFQASFLQSLLMSRYISDILLHDLEQGYPELWERFREAQQRYYHALQLLYEQGIAAEVFQPINPFLLVLQEEQALSSIMDPIFLIKNDLTLRKTLHDFYVLRKFLVLTSEAREGIDDTVVQQRIDEISYELSMNMR
jgi:AcrR family transcriptional regulator